MESKLGLLLIIGSALAFEIEVAQNESPIDRYKLFKTMACVRLSQAQRVVSACVRRVRFHRTPKDSNKLHRTLGL